MADGRLPPLDDRFTVDVDLVDAYRRDGHVAVRGLATRPEVEPYRAAIRSSALRLSQESRPMEERDTYSQAFLQVMNLWRHDPVVERFVFAARFAGVAAQLLGVERVRVYHDQALFKEPSGGRTPWHQDAVYWPISGERCVTMWMPLVDVATDMGGMGFATGTNAVGSLADEIISDRSEQHFETLVADRQWPVSSPGAMAAGDATFHGGWTLHHAQRNESSTMREVMTVIYFADGLVVDEPDNDAQRRDMARWLPGLAPGDLAASDLNPVVASPA